MARARARAASIKRRGKLMQRLEREGHAHSELEESVRARDIAARGYSL